MKPLNSNPAAGSAFNSCKILMPSLSKDLTVCFGECIYGSSGISVSVYNICICFLVVSNGGNTICSRSTESLRKRIPQIKVKQSWILPSLAVGKRTDT